MKKYQPYPTRDALKNYFPMPNEIFSLDLTAGEIAVYGYLMSLENRKTYQYWPSYKTIGKAVKMSNNTVRKYVLMLEENGFIQTEPTSIITKSGMKWNGNLRYTIRPIQEAIEQNYAKQMAQLEVDTQRQHVAALLPSCGDLQTGVDTQPQNTL